MGKKSGEVLEVFKTFSNLTLKCMDHSLDPSSGQRKVFKVLVDKNVQVTKGCDIQIFGPWHTFEQNDTQVLSHASKVTVIQNGKIDKAYVSESETIYRPNCS